MLLPLAPVLFGPTPRGAGRLDGEAELLLERAGDGAADGVVLPLVAAAICQRLERLAPEPEYQAFWI